MSRLWSHLLGNYDNPENLAAFTEALDPEIRITRGREIPPDAEFEILVAGRPSAEDLAASPKLHTLLIPYAGVPIETRELLLANLQIAVHNLHHNAAAAAELALALLLAASKFLVPMDRALRAGDWSPRYEPNPGLLLGGKRAVVLGYGEIGRRIARFCRGLGMDVAAIRRRPELSPPDGETPTHAPEALPDLLGNATALLAALPLTEKTRGLVGGAALERLPTESVLVNVGRAEVFDEAELFARLRDGRLRAAGLDVWYRYPQSVAERSSTPPGNFPFGELDNLVLSPHRGGALGLAESERMRMQALAASLNAAARALPLPHPVDIAEGY
jgi:phosphoglycerate dehydrogenase-like enzyme